MGGGKGMSMGIDGEGGESGARTLGLTKMVFYLRIKYIMSQN